MQARCEAMRPGLSSPEKDEDQAGANGLVSRDQTAGAGADSDAKGVTDQALLAKRVATARARAALVGATLIEMPDDAGRPEWLLTRWTLTRAFHDLSELETLLDRMGAPA